MCPVRPPPQAEIYAPEFPPKMDWLNVAFLRMNTLMGRGAVLVEFWDFARVNSLRTMPYLKAWHERYSDAGLRVIGHGLGDLLQMQSCRSLQLGRVDVGLEGRGDETHQGQRAGGVRRARDVVGHLRP